MDTTMNYIGTLASYMGYAWSSGCWAKRVGEDFRKKGDTWESTYREDRCELKGGPKKNVRLKITYENFAFTLKDVKFGKSFKPPISLDQEKQLMNSPDRSYSKVVTNRKANPGHSTEVHIDIRVASTLKNVQRSSWDQYFAMEAGMEYEPPTATGGDIKGTDESTLVRNSLAPLMHYDPSDLGSLTMIQITPKERNLGHLMATADEIFTNFRSLCTLTPDSSPVVLMQLHKARGTERGGSAGYVRSSLAPQLCAVPRVVWRLLGTSQHLPNKIQMPFSFFTGIS